jgi:carotenoid cleavage dioxygenase
MCTHVMGAWSEGDVLHVDMDGAEINQFPFFPKRGEERGPEPMPPGQIRRFTVDLADPAANSFGMEVLFPEISGVLARQDDRYHTLPYRYGFLLSIGPTGPAWTMVDHKAGTTATYTPPPGSVPAEMCFVPRHKGAAEGDGYLIGVVNHMREAGRSDLILVDTRDVAAGPIATIKMPCRIVRQVHGFWVPGDALSA